MPEGDTIHHAANRIRPVLEGRVPDEIVHAAAPPRRRPLARAARRTRGATRRGARQAPAPALRGRSRPALAPAHDRQLGRPPAGARWRRAPRRAWLVMRAAGGEVVQFDGPLLELLTEARARSDPQLAGPRPGRARRALRRARGDPAPARRRPDAAVRRRPDRPAHDRRDRQHLEVGVLLRRRRRPVEAGRRDRRGDRRSPRSASPASTWRSRRATASSRGRARSTGAPASRARAAARRSAAPARASRTARPTGARECQR